MSGTRHQRDARQSARRRVIRDLSLVFGLLLAACALVLCLAPLSLAFAETAPAQTGPTQTGPAQSAPGLTDAEQDALSRSIERCWAVSALSPAAQQAIIAVAVTIGPDKKPVGATVKLTRSDADETARRAVLRCGAIGLPLPDGKEAAWGQLELIFDKGRVGL